MTQFDDHDSIEEIYDKNELREFAEWYLEAEKEVKEMKRAKREGAQKGPAENYKWNFGK